MSETSEGPSLLDQLFADLPKFMEEEAARKAALPFKPIREGAPVTGVAIDTERNRPIASGRYQPGTLVKVRLAGDEKTHLGLYLGDIARSALAEIVTRPNLERGIVVSMTSHNPAMLVPALQRIVFGSESWWGKIESVDDLKDITDADIANVWYVKAAQDLAKAAGIEPTPRKTS